MHGTGALFSAAYGNVGSSIYYALGVVALYALGLTPVTFMIAGLIFVFTAATYTEATVMYPEAGGSSSFARHAFNEAVSFFAAWGQMLTYIITIAISAFFVPHYLAVFWEPLGHGPGDVIGGSDPDRGAGAAQHQGQRGVGAAQPGARDRGPRHADPAGADRPRAGAQSRPTRLAGGAGRGADLGGLPARDRGRDGRLHGDRDDLEHGRGGQGRQSHDSPRSRARRSGRDRAIRAAADHRAVRDAGRAGGEWRIHDGAGYDVRRRSGARNRREHRARSGADRRAARSTSGCSRR